MELLTTKISLQLSYFTPLFSIDFSEYNKTRRVTIGENEPVENVFLNIVNGTLVPDFALNLFSICWSVKIYLTLFSPWNNRSFACDSDICNLSSIFAELIIDIQ